TELWKSDGTEAGTVMVRDINTVVVGQGGTADSFYPSLPGSTTTGKMRVVGSTLFFTANDGSGVELWKTDGTTTGTVMVKDIDLGSFGSLPANFGVVASTLYFSANNGSNGQGVELWKTDGTTLGTVMVKDINTQTELENVIQEGIATDSSSPTQLTTVGSTLFFRATDGTSGVELWKTDGTAAGTVLVKDINPGTANSNPNNLTAFGSSLLFSATDGDPNFGIELWKSDGSAEGTVMAADVYAVGSSNPGQFKVFGSAMLFAANGGTGAHGVELWKTDGTEDGTVLVKDINPGTANSAPNQLTLFDDSVYFAATSAAKGTELWKTDGTAAGTVLVEDLNPGSASSSPTGLTPAPRTMLFSAVEPATGRELWRLADPANAPVAVDDVYATPAGTPLIVAAPGVLGNDTDAEGETLTAGSASDPPNGSVTLAADGSFVYTPDAGFSGSDRFTYIASDGDGGTDVAIVTIAVNTPPDAVDDAYTTAEDTPVTVAAPGVLGNDTDLDGHALTAASPSTPGRGSVSLNPDGSFTYTPDAGFAGADSFTYTATDGNGGTDTATVNITV
ncbi:MAG: tandem-95 repeat protein, partial [Actinobacteria bacterium]|nr:tandem-95 repeat protein [Actinomycetota bacterium]